jgi:Replication-relaxation
MGSLRLPRFKRSNAVAPLHLTKRDKEIVERVFRHRFLRSDHITALCAGSAQQITRRLQRLFHHGYLDRPRCQIDYFQSGSRRIAYGLGKEGLNWLKRERPHLFHGLTAKRQNFIGRLFLEHALLVSEIMIAVELACRRRNDVRFLWATDSEEFVPSQWGVSIAQHLKCQVVPDFVFGLEYRGKRCWYFVEADRGTMPVTRRKLERSSLRRKFECYAATWEQKLTQEFGVSRFRVLTVTTKPDRVDSMIEVCCDKIRSGQGLFLFATMENLRKHEDFWTPFWQTAYSESPVALLN